MKVLLFFEILFVTVLGITAAEMAETTCNRLARHGYPCESHSVQTSDGYILTMFRIPYSPHSNHHQMNITKPPVLLMHCVLCSSDVWILNGPNDGLPYLLADAGYDVWMGNARGNVYSQRHVSLSPSWWAFWDFSWDEIGLIDLPAKIDYMLAATAQQSIHYVGYSQGTTVFMVLLSSKPSYGEKIRSSHLLAPGVFLCHLKSPLVVLMASVLGRPNLLARIAGTFQTTVLDRIIRAVSPGICKQPPLDSWCANILNFITGWRTPYLNMTLVPDLLQTTPADCSTRQILHFMQSHISCEFKAYDHGYRGNLRRYGQAQPPPYNLANIQLHTPIAIYFSDNDYLASVEDIGHLADILGSRVILHRVKFPKFNHFDFTLAENVKTVINNCVVDKMNKYEGLPFNGSMCNNFRDTPF